jgi:hypothetical protein
MLVPLSVLVIPTHSSSDNADRSVKRRRNISAIILLLMRQ